MSATAPHAGLLLASRAAEAAAATPPQPVPTHRVRFRVYWEDTDAAGVVYYANYLRFMERARSDWLRELGFTQSWLRETARQVFVVGEVGLRYVASARLDDTLEVATQVLELKARTLLLAQDVWRAQDATLLVHGRVKLVCVDVETMRSVRMLEVVQQSLRQVAPGMTATATDHTATAPNPTALQLA